MGSGLWAYALRVERIWIFEIRVRVKGLGFGGWVCDFGVAG